MSNVDNIFLLPLLDECFELLESSNSQHGRRICFGVESSYSASKEWHLWSKSSATPTASEDGGGIEHMAASAILRLMKSKLVLEVRIVDLVLRRLIRLVYGCELMYYYSLAGFPVKHSHRCRRETAIPLRHCRRLEKSHLIRMYMIQI